MESPASGNAKCMVYTVIPLMNVGHVDHIFRTLDRSRVSTSRPTGMVARDAVFVYDYVPDDKEYWRDDGYTWRDLRTKKKPKNDPWVNRHDFHLLHDGREVDFRRKEYELLDLAHPRRRQPCVVVWYSGTFNLQKYRAALHGNTKATPDKIQNQILRELMLAPSPIKSPHKLGEVGRKRTGGYFKFAARRNILVSPSTVPPPVTGTSGAIESPRSADKNADSPSDPTAGTTTLFLEDSPVGLSRRLPIPPIFVTPVKRRPDIEDHFSASPNTKRQRVEYDEEETGTDLLQTSVMFSTKVPEPRVHLSNFNITEPDILTQTEHQSDESSQMQQDTIFSQEMQIEEDDVVVEENLEGELSPLIATSANAQAPLHRLEDMYSSPEESSESDQGSQNDTSRPAPMWRHKTHPTVTKIIRKKIQENKAPAQIEAEILAESVQKHGRYIPSMVPKNSKKIHNEKYRAKREKLHDDIFELYLFSKNHPDVLLKHDLVPEFIIIQTHPEMILHFNSFVESMDVAVLHYDTTFEIGRFFTSILSLRHSVFKNSPVVPVAVMFHEKTTELSHATFFRSAKDVLHLDTPKVVIVTDREKGITNAIANELKKARNVYCWNHIKQNIKRWLESRHRSKDVLLYCDNIIALLKSSSRDEFDNNLLLFRGQWDNSFISYYEKHLEQSILGTYRPVLEIMGIYNAFSGITNNPAESANASLKRNIPKKATFYQAMNCWYFFQGTSLLHIHIGLSSTRQGNYIPRAGIPAGLHLPSAMEAINPEVYSPMIMEGKIPTGLFTNASYKSVNKYDAVTNPGIASWLILNDRITHLPRDGTFAVRGPGLQRCLVNLANSSCSCLRTGLCVHLQAVLKCTGIKKKLPRCRPRLSRVYNKAIQKSTGTKKGQTRAMRIRTTEIVQKDLDQEPFQEENQLPPFQTRDTPPLSPDGEPEIDMSKGHLKEHDKVLPLKAGEVKFPVIKNTNYFDNYLSLPSGTITVTEIKTLQSSFTNAEQRKMGILLKDQHICNPDWLVDSVIDGFLMTISDMAGNGFVSITASETQRMLTGEDCAMLFSNDGKRDYHDWTQVSGVLLPYNLGGRHWILIVVSPAQKEVYVFDPVGMYALNKEFLSSIQNLFNPKFDFPEGTVWQDIYPTTCRNLGINANQCGPFICFYAEAFVTESSLEQMPDVSEFRQHMAKTLIGSCTPMSNSKAKKCIRCKPAVVPREECWFCKRKACLTCLKAVDVRGRRYNICA